MKKNTIFPIVFISTILLQWFGWLAHADGPTGTVNYNGQTIQVNNGSFILNGVSGTIDANGNYSIGGNTGNIGSTAGVQGYQVQGQSYVPVTPVPSSSPSVPKWPTGTVQYKGQSITVTNGSWKLPDGTTGTLDFDGTVKASDGKVIGNINDKSIEGVGTINLNNPQSNHRIISGTDRNGQQSNVDIDSLAQSMKNGSFDINAFWVWWYAQWIGFTNAQVKEFQTFVSSHSAQEIANKLATLPVDTVLKIDEIRPRSSSAPGIAMRVGPDWIASSLKNTPESWQNVLEYAGITVTKADLDKLYNASKADITQMLGKLPNDQFEKIQAYFFNGVDIHTSKPYFSQGWDDLSAYSPEIGRVVSPAEKNAIERIKAVAILQDFSADRNGNLTAFAKSQVDPSGSSAFLAWKPGTFKSYLTEAAIADYVAHPDKGVFAGGSNNTINWKDGTTTIIGNKTSAIGTIISTTMKSPTNQQIREYYANNPDIKSNPYASSLSSGSKTKIDAWISSKILSKKDTLDSENYTLFIQKILGKLDVAKTKTSNKNILNIINYIAYGLRDILDQSSINNSFLDSLID